jgi:2-methylaconitate cis-trans-isomerase PrpF
VTGLATAGTLPAVFMRGGTGRAPMLRRQDVPGDIAPDLDAAVRIVHAPVVGLVAPPQDSSSPSGAAIRAADVDLTARVMSNGAPRQALPRTVALCRAAAARIEGGPVHEAAHATGDAALRVGMPSGILTADAVVARDGGWRAEPGSFFRTARPPMRGGVFHDAVTPG